MHRLVPPVLAIFLFGAAASASAAGLVANVRNQGGDVVEDAVVVAVPVDASGKPVAGGPVTMIDQVDKEYVPYVTAVQKGTKVNFPNHDDIRHHVYSFSKAKTFEIPLYKGTPPDPIRFDEAGIVVLGCNIHDWMKAYVYIADSPFFALTDETGKARLDGLPAGNYRVTTWHPRLSGSEADTAQQVTVGSGEKGVDFTIPQKRVWRPRRAPTGGGPTY